MNTVAIAAALKNKVPPGSPLIPIEKRVHASVQLLGDKEIRLVLDNWKDRSTAIDGVIRKTLARRELPVDLQKRMLEADPKTFLHNACEIDPSVQKLAASDDLRPLVKDGIGNIADFKEYDQGFLNDLVAQFNTMRLKSPSVVQDFRDMVSREVFVPSAAAKKNLQALFEYEPRIALAGDDDYVIQFIDGEDGYNRILAAANKDGLSVDMFNEHFGSALDKAAVPKPNIGAKNPNVATRYQKWRAFLKDASVQSAKDGAPVAFATNNFKMGGKQLRMPAPYLAYLLKHFDMRLLKGDGKRVDLRGFKADTLGAWIGFDDQTNQGRVLLQVRGYKDFFEVAPRLAHETVATADAMYELFSYIDGASRKYKEFDINQARHDLEAAAEPAAADAGDVAEDKPATGVVVDLTGAVELGSPIDAKSALAAFAKNADVGDPDTLLYALVAERAGMRDLWLAVTGTPRSKQIAFNRLYPKDDRIGFGALRQESGQYALVFFAAGDDEYPVADSKLLSLLTSKRPTTGLFNAVTEAIKNARKLKLTGAKLSGALTLEDELAEAALTENYDSMFDVLRKALGFTDEPATEVDEEAATEETPEEAGNEYDLSEAGLAGDVIDALGAIADQLADAPLAEGEPELFTGTDPIEFVSDLHDIARGTEHPDTAAGVVAEYHDATPVIKKLAKIDADALTLDDVDQANIASLLALIAANGEVEDAGQEDTSADADPASKVVAVVNAVSDALADAVVNEDVGDYLADLTAADLIDGLIDGSENAQALADVDLQGLDADQFGSVINDAKVEEALRNLDDALDALRAGEEDNEPATDGDLPDIDLPEVGVDDEAPEAAAEPEDGEPATSTGPLSDYGITADDAVAIYNKMENALQDDQAVKEFAVSENLMPDEEGTIALTSQNIAEFASDATFETALADHDGLYDSLKASIETVNTAWLDELLALTEQPDFYLLAEETPPEGTTETTDTEPAADGEGNTDLAQEYADTVDAVVNAMSDEDLSTVMATADGDAQLANLIAGQPTPLEADLSEAALDAAQENVLGAHDADFELLQQVVNERVLAAFKERHSATPDMFDDTEQPAEEPAVAEEPEALDATATAQGNLTAIFADADAADLKAGAEAFVRKIVSDGYVDAAAVIDASPAKEADEEGFVKIGLKALEGTVHELPALDVIQDYFPELDDAVSDWYVNTTDAGVEINAAEDMLQDTLFATLRQRAPGQYMVYVDGEEAPAEEPAAVIPEDDNAPILAWDDEPTAPAAPAPVAAPAPAKAPAVAPAEPEELPNTDAELPDIDLPDYNFDNEEPAVPTASPEPAADAVLDDNEDADLTGMFDLPAVEDAQAEAGVTEADDAAIAGGVFDLVETLSQLPPTQSVPASLRLATLRDEDGNVSAEDMADVLATALLAGDKSLMPAPILKTVASRLQGATGKKALTALILNALGDGPFALTY